MLQFFARFYILHPIFLSDHFHCFRSLFTCFHAFCTTIKRPWLLRRIPRSSNTLSSSQFHPQPPYPPLFAFSSPTSRFYAFSLTVNYFQVLRRALTHPRPPPAIFSTNRPFSNSYIHWWPPTSFRAFPFFFQSLPRVFTRLQRLSTVYKCQYTSLNLHTRFRDPQYNFTPIFDHFRLFDCFLIDFLSFSLLLSPHSSPASSPNPPTIVLATRYSISSFIAHFFPIFAHFYPFLFFLSSFLYLFKHILLLSTIYNPSSVN